MTAKKKATKRKRSTAKKTVKRKKHPGKGAAKLKQITIKAKALRKSNASLTWIQALRKAAKAA